MLIEKQYKIEESASTDSCRPSINHVKIDEFNGKPVAVATNGRILACVPVEATPQEYGLLGISALKLARQTSKGKDALEITLNGTQDLANGVKLPRPEGEYPNWKQVLPAADRPVAFRCCFDPFLLASLCKSLGIDKNKSVTLEFAPDMEGGHPDSIVVKGAGGTFGVLMPMRIG